MADLVVDVWANYWDRAFFQAEPLLAGLYERLSLQPRMALDGDDLAREAAAGGVDKVVLSGTAFPGSPAGNDAVAAAIQRHPDLLVGVASVDPRTGMAAVRELRRAVTELDFRALKLFPYVYDRPPNDAIYYPLYATCIDLAIPVLLLTGHTAVRAASEPGRPHYLDDVCLHFPELVVVAGHAGFPWTQELVSLAWKHEKLYIDSSGHRPKYFPPEFTHFLNSFGRRKVMFGTGWPLMDHAGPLRELDALELKPASRAAFLGGNAASVLGLAPS